MKVQEITDKEFKSLINENTRIIIKFYADWCGSCKLFAPKYSRISEMDEYDQVKFLKINAEKNPETRKWAGVSNLPYFAVVKEGQLISGDFTAKEESVIRLIDKIK